MAYKVFCEHLESFQKLLESNDLSLTTYLYNELSSLLMAGKLEEAQIILNMMFEIYQIMSCNDQDKIVIFAQFESIMKVVIENIK